MNRLIENEKTCQQALSQEIVELSDEDLEKVVGGSGDERDHGCGRDCDDWGCYRDRDFFDRGPLDSVLCLLRI